MKTDLYTKIVLTVIAVALSVNLIKGFITPAKADNRKFVNVPVNADGSINVNIKKSSETMEVKLVDVDSRAFFYSEPIPVKVK
ncbi:hypothetical protein [Mucilaginibacter sp. OK098]|uniref:hypothetical protein n=1 Tax=Mucilaginibacter sp. OK098 TaxID=1855297 RepID=UPI00091BC537|nr:hypothetical protein [Mucilaginibacter sp. OK098]SHN33150.1 hypothetical protein SAMN05216524_11055 [Mucilaginibacter sp. OK098]